MRTKAIMALSLILGLTVQLSLSGKSPEMRKITRQSLEDKIRGGWAGKMIGVSYGAPTEFKSNGKINEAEMKWRPDMVSNAIGQDDLYVGMTMAETMDRLGLDASTEQYGEAFKNSQYHLWHANAGARRLLNQGIKAPWSGHPKYNIHANDIDFQIEADFIGLMCPGLPQLSNAYSDRVGRVMNYGDGLYGGMFINGMYAAAFFDTDPRRIVEQGLACLPARSEYARLVSDVLRWSKENPGDWRKTWQLIEDNWDKNDPCPDGSLSSFNIDAKINGAYIVLGLLYGNSDFAKTMEITTRGGQDSDCNPSTAAGILGVSIGYSAIPEQFKSGIAPLADKKFSYTNSSFNDITRSTIARAVKVIQMAGGKADGDELRIPVQTPKPAKLEQWDMGIPDKEILARERAWSWKGSWVEDMGGKDQEQFQGMKTEQPGSEAVLAFDGSALAIQGVCSQSGGRADVYLDGKKLHGIDAYIVERTWDDALWHVYGLKPGPHTVRIVATGTADPRSKGKAVVIARAITYKAKR